jgi:two-component system LytT family response regulator
VIESLQPHETPEIVFVTAYDTFAVRAFDAHAVDYLLKPVSAPHLARALDRARERLVARRGISLHRDVQAIAAGIRRVRPDDRIPVAFGNRIDFVSAQEVTWIEMKDTGAVVHVGVDAYPSGDLFAQLDRLLRLAAFARVHPSSIVNLDAVVAVEGTQESDCRLVLAGGDVVAVSPQYRASLLERLGIGLPSASGDQGNSPTGRDVIAFGDVVVDRRAREVTRGGSRVTLAPREWDLLLALLRHPGQVLSRTELLRSVWGYQTDVVSRTVDMHILELRHKLEADPARPRWIITVRKMGYRLSITGSDHAASPGADAQA